MLTVDTLKDQFSIISQRERVALLSCITMENILSTLIISLWCQQMRSSSNLLRNKQTVLRKLSVIITFQRNSNNKKKISLVLLVKVCIATDYWLWIVSAWTGLSLTPKIWPSPAVELRRLTHFHHVNQQPVKTRKIFPWQNTKWRINFDFDELSLHSIIPQETFSWTTIAGRNFIGSSNILDWLNWGVRSDIHI